MPLSEMPISALPADSRPGAGLGPRPRLVREERPLSVREPARRIGCSASLISQIERDHPRVGGRRSALVTECDSIP